MFSSVKKIEMPLQQYQRNRKLSFSSKFLSDRKIELFIMVRSMFNSAFNSCRIQVRFCNILDKFVGQNSSIIFNPIWRGGSFYHKFGFWGPRITFKEHFLLPFWYGKTILREKTISPFVYITLVLNVVSNKSGF